MKNRDHDNNLVLLFHYFITPLFLWFAWPIVSVGLVPGLVENGTLGANPGYGVWFLFVLFSKINRGGAAAPIHTCSVD